MEIILDTSVIVKWFVPGEDGEETALSILEDIEKKKVFIYEPFLLIYEFNHVLNKLVKYGKQDLAFTQKVMRKFCSFARLYMRIENDPLDYSEDLLNLSLKYKISSYDGTFVALAIRKDIPLYTADKELVLRVKRDIPFVKDFFEYR